eukprot:gene7838-9198_t
MSSSSTSMLVIISVLLLVSSTAVVSAQCPNYKLVNVQQTKKGYEGSMLMTTAGSYGENIEVLSFVAYFQAQDILRVKIYDPKIERWEVPLVNQMKPPTSKPTYLDYNIRFNEVGFFGFSVTRVSTGQVLFNTTAPLDCSTNGLIYSNHYLEMTTTFAKPNPNLYGLGERAAPLRLNNSFTYTLFAKDQQTPVNLNLYGSHPFYLQVAENGDSHGVFLLNSNAMDIVLQPNSLTYKVIGGIFDMFFFLGPTPSQVIQQYSQVIGTPAMPSYWSLGWHQCRWGYSSVEMSQQVALNYSKYGIPLETMWNDIDYMNAFEDFTLDQVNFAPADMSNYIEYLHSNDQHYIMIVDPGIHINESYPSYKALLDSGAHINTEEGEPLEGSVWPGPVIFPDFLHPNAQNYWTDELSAFYDMVAFDGIWIDMNEVSNFCNGDCGGDQSVSRKMVGQFDPNNPPYIPGGFPLDVHTINLTAVQYPNVSVYDSHNLYGYTESIATVKAAQLILGHRSTVISRSTFPGSGVHNGHWLGDNSATYDDLYLSIPGILNMNMFGIPLVGADICGFNLNTTMELCSRWMQLGNFYPFSRNHNSLGMAPQEPYVFGQQLIDISINAINLKYSLLPIYYTLFYRAHVDGGTVVRPLFFEYPADPNTWAIDRQFLLGSHILVSPVLVQGAVTVSAYFPTDTWYDFFTGAPVPTTQVGTTVTLDAPLDKINVHVRGGIILPLQPTASYVPPPNTIPVTTKVARTLPMTLIVAMANNEAHGELFIDDGISLHTVQKGHYSLIEFHALQHPTMLVLQSSNVQEHYDISSYTIDTIVIYGSQPVTEVIVNGVDTTSFVYNSANQTLTINKLSLPLETYFIINTMTSQSEKFSLSLK